MKTLYVSDLDGTLLNSQETTTQYTNQIINELVDNGMLFSYATARSYTTATKATKGICVKIPLIVYNGVMIVENNSGEILHSCYFKRIKHIINELINNNFYPIVYSIIDNKERFSYIRKTLTKEAKEFVDSRNDYRNRPVNSIEELLQGDIFYITIINNDRKLKDFYEKYKDTYHCIYSKDIYSQSYWLEITPKEASKSNAIKKLKSLYKCDKVVVFGDGENDIDMFLNADECYAVSNACDKIKEIANDIIGSHNEDAVAKWLYKHNKKVD